jgi:tetratricopeptide (TPR) repeat protein
LFELAHDCLRRTVDGNPDYAEAIACLSHLATDGHRFGFAPAESFARLRRQAAELAHKAVGLSSQSSRGHHALGWSYWFAHDASASLKALQTALALNSNATEVMADLGLVWSLLGEWERGVPLLEEAWMRQPSQRGVSCFGLSLYHFMNGRYGDALTYANAVEMPDLAHGLVVRAISLVRLGRKAEAAQAVDGILSMAPYSGQHRLAELAGAHVNPALAEGVLSALADAGLRTDRTQH